MFLLVHESSYSFTICLNICYIPFSLLRSTRLIIFANVVSDKLRQLNLNKIGETCALPGTYLSD